MKLISAVRRRTLAADIEARLAAYASDLPSQAIGQIQLELLNREWARTIKRIPFYSKLVAASAAPLGFDNLEHFFAVTPIVNRPLIRQHAAEMCDRRGGRIHGESPGAPLHSRSNSRHGARNSFTRGTTCGRRGAGIQLTQGHGCSFSGVTAIFLAQE